VDGAFAFLSSLYFVLGEKPVGDFVFAKKEFLTMILDLY
jgi:hypothetical protein